VQFLPIHFGYNSTHAEIERKAKFKNLNIGTHNVRGAEGHHWDDGLGALAALDHLQHLLLPIDHLGQDDGDWLRDLHQHA
jgi:hypothetical protein